MLSRKIIPTEDGSSTIYIPEWNESYHSKHGAIQEAYHVFIQNGLNGFSNNSEISILEIGFGTGLNSLITLNESLTRNLKIQYTGIEKYPVSEQEAQSLHYAKSLKEFNPKIKRGFEELEEDYSKLMKAPWEEFSGIHADFQLRKIQADFLDFNYPEEEFDLVYFDAFGARVQPELWTEELLGKIYASMKKGGLFTTYSAKGSVRRALMAVGMEVEKRPGPPGKREMLVARKP